LKYINELKENDHLSGHYFCRQKLNLKTRSGKTYLSLKLMDKTGQLDAKVWEMNNDIEDFSEGDYIRIEGSVLTYQNELQLKIIKIRKSEPGEYAPSDYIPCTEKDIGLLYSELSGYVKTLSDPHIKKLAESILVDDKAVADSLMKCTAAKNMHHSYMGGLLEHTVSVVKLCDFLSQTYAGVNRDILLVTAMLHDIGKIYELTDLPENAYTDDGQLLGHIVMGAQMVSNVADRLTGFPHGLKSLLTHSILAHHGEYEFGSPKLPYTLEAFILHCADNIDAKVKSFEETFKNDGQEGAWTGRNNMLARNLRRTVY